MNTIDADGARQYLRENKWPEGLQETVIQSMITAPIRFFIIDDSGSMSNSDGMRILHDGNKTK